jgi:hypothetical protein
MEMNAMDFNYKHSERIKYLNNKIVKKADYHLFQMDSKAQK